MRVHPTSVGHRKNRDGSIRNLAAVSVIVFAGLTASTSLASTVVLDNTDGALHATMNSAFGSTRWIGKAFTTGSTASTIDTISMALRNEAGNSTTEVTVDLYASDPSSSTKPTGEVLDSFSQTFSLTTSNAFFTLNVNDAIALAAETSYVLVFRNDNNVDEPDAVQWALRTDFSSSVTASDGFAFIGTSQTYDSGGFWSPGGQGNVWQMSVNADASAVPGIGGLAAIAGVGLAGRRRRR